MSADAPIAIDTGHHLSVEDSQTSKLSSEVFRGKKEVTHGRSRFTVGVPFRRGEFVHEAKEITNSPHIFVAHELWLADRDHEKLLLLDAPLVLGHGWRHNGRWEFGDGQEVVQVVCDYEEWAKSQGLPCLHMVIACNEDEEIADWEKKEGITFLDLVGRVPHPIIQAVGHVLEMPRRGWGMDDQGKIIVDVSTEGKLAGLDEVVDFEARLREIKIG